MPERALTQLDLQPQHLALLRKLLHQHLPHVEIWAYGSRVNGDGQDASDLDLVVRQPANLKQATPQLWAMKEILVESNLPIRVDLVDWAQIPANFQGEIERAYVVIQPANEKV